MHAAAITTFVVAALLGCASAAATAATARAVASATIVVLVDVRTVAASAEMSSANVASIETSREGEAVHLTVAFN